LLRDELLSQEIRVFSNIFNQKNQGSDINEIQKIKLKIAKNFQEHLLSLVKEGNTVVSAIFSVTSR